MKIKNTLLIFLMLFTLKINAYTLLDESYWQRKSNHIMLIKSALDDGLYIKDAKNEYGITILHNAAIYADNPKIIRVLVDAGIDVNVRDRDYNTPLHEAAYKNKHPGIITALIELGAFVNALNNEGESPLHNAAHYDNLADVEVLLKAGAKVNVRNIYLQTPLHEAVLNNQNLDIVKMLVNAGAEINTNDSHGETLLNTAKHNKNPKIYEFLQQKIKLK